jgi:hypothetical protein
MMASNSRFVPSGRVADRMGTQVCRDRGISGAEGRDDRPQFDRLSRNSRENPFLPRVDGDIATRAKRRVSFALS